MMKRQPIMSCCAWCWQMAVLDVLEFGRQKRELEQVFMQLVQEEDNGRK
jgi:hypothetical protein